MEKLDFIYITFKGFYMPNWLFESGKIHIFGLIDYQASGGVKSFTRPGFVNHAAVERSSEMWNTKR